MASRAAAAKNVEEPPYVRTIADAAGAKNVEEPPYVRTIADAAGAKNVEGPPYVRRKLSAQYDKHQAQVFHMHPGASPCCM